MKKIRKNPRHLKFIRTLPCSKCISPPLNQATHVRKYKDGGTGLKPSDMFTVPLCHNCHHKQHNVGELTFWGDRYDHTGQSRLDMLMNALYEQTGNHGAGVNSILHFQKGGW